MNPFTQDEVNRMKPGLSLSLLTACASLVSALPVGAQVTGDFDNDGFDDFAIGVPGENIGAVDAGAVSVIYGRANGLAPWASVHDQFWHENRPGMPDTSEKDDQLGRSLAVGDFDGDGFDDLAIGVPGERLGPHDNAGAVIVIYGSNVGLVAVSIAQFWHQARLFNANDDPASGDRFGESVAAGDFDGDGFDDLAVGVPGETFGIQQHAGGVALIYGSSLGLQDHRYRMIRQSTNGLADDNETGDHFGRSLASGDFNNDGLDDLAIGAPGEDLSGRVDAGSVHVLYGAPLGLSDEISQLWHQDSPGIANQLHDGDEFGATLATGDFDGDGFGDLVIGVRGEDVVGPPFAADAGAVHVLFGRPNGLRASRSQFFTQDKAVDADDRPEPGDRFSEALAAGDFDGDGFDDLAIGAPLETVGARREAGAVSILRGSASGITTADSQFWHGAVRARDHYGAALASGDFDNDGRDDLAVGSPGREEIAAPDHGVVHVLYGRPTGLSLQNAQLLLQGGPGMLDHADPGDRFGAGNAFAP
jgi:hypothetical protein